MREPIEKAAKLARIALKEEEFPGIEQAFTGLMAHFERIGTVEVGEDDPRSTLLLREDILHQEVYQPEWEERETKDQALVIPRVMD
jgi:Asp-tRNA(Asn)/Glu-tRNA(Gln) amidotransferase C subunit